MIAIKWEMTSLINSLFMLVLIIHIETKTKTCIINNEDHDVLNDFGL